MSTVILNHWLYVWREQYFKLYGGSIIKQLRLSFENPLMLQLPLSFSQRIIIIIVSINTQVIIQNRALSLARYLGLSADNHLDGQNGCQ